MSYLTLSGLLKNYSSIRNRAQSKLFSSVKMFNRHKVEGYEEFIECMKSFITVQEPVYIIFSGNEEANGQSWCDDCVKAFPIIEEAVSRYCEPAAHLIYVKVGDKPYWKDMNCPFRRDPDLHLMVIPTIIKWKTPKRLEGGQCEQIELLELLFNDD